MRKTAFRDKIALHRYMKKKVILKKADIMEKQRRNSGETRKI